MPDYLVDEGGEYLATEDEDYLVTEFDMGTAFPLMLMMRLRLANLFPNASTTGPQADTVFTDASGEINTSSDGQVIENLNLTGYILVRHNNVTIQDCIITGSSGDIMSIVPVVASRTNLTIRRCRIVGFQGVSCIAIESISGVEVAHCDLSNVENGITVSASNVNIHDCYIHNLQKTAGDPHFDGIQGFPGPYTNWTINHNTFETRDTSGIITGGSSPAVRNSGLVISNNKFVPMMAVSYGIQVTYTDTVTVTNNRFGKFGVYPTFPADFIGVTGLTFTGNVDDATDAPITPSIA